MTAIMKAEELPRHTAKRPRLSLSIDQTPTLGSSIPRYQIPASKPPGLSPTAFNTLSSAYAAVIERSSPQSGKAGPRLPPLQKSEPNSLRLITSCTLSERFAFPSQQIATVVSSRVDTPVGALSSAEPSNPDSACTPSTYTPPSSALMEEISSPQQDLPNVKLELPASKLDPPSTRADIQSRRRATVDGTACPRKAPYAQPLNLHSILRNSPFTRPQESATTVSPMTEPTIRVSSPPEAMRKRVCYNMPLTQTITTNTYIRSHIELLSDDASPFAPSPAQSELLMTTPETRDGGHTPGPFEEMRRRLADLGDGDGGGSSVDSIDKDTDIRNRPDRTSGIVVGKRKRGEKVRRWVWTIGTSEDEEYADVPGMADIAATTSRDDLEMVKADIGGVGDKGGLISMIEEEFEGEVVSNRPGSACSV